MNEMGVFLFLVVSYHVHIMFILMTNVLFHDDSWSSNVTPVTLWYN